MEIFLVTLVVVAVGARFARWGLGAAGFMKTAAEAEASKLKARRICGEAEKLKAILEEHAAKAAKGDANAMAGSVPTEIFIMPSVGDFLLAAEQEPLTTHNRRCRRAVENLRQTLIRDFGFDAASFALLRDKAQGREDKKLRKVAKRTAAKRAKVPSRR